VAVKVQRPSIVEAFRKDLAILSGYLWILRMMRFMRWAEWGEMFETVQQTLVEELDYRLEVASMRRMRKLLKVEKVISPRRTRNTARNASSRWSSSQFSMIRVISLRTAFMSRFVGSTGSMVK
jgi:ABC1 atypical kinase-like domain